MTSVVLGWNPASAFGAGPGRIPYRTAVDAVQREGLFRTRWRVGRAQRLEPATDAWLFVQGRQGRGLLGHGLVAGAPQPVPALPPRLGLLAEVEFDLLLEVGDTMPAELLEDTVPGVAWNAVRSTGTIVPAASEPVLRAAWTGFLRSRPVPAGGLGAADPTVPVPGALPQAALRRVAVNRFEHDPEAVRLCVAFHGPACAACGLTLEQLYGPAGAAFVQVHQIVPASGLEPGYRLDPVSDLVPLCPNCHAMAHRGTPDPYTPAELRRMLAGASAQAHSGGPLRGEVSSAPQLRAAADAARLRDTQ